MTVRYIPRPSDSGNGLWFIHDLEAKSTHKPHSVEWLDDVLVKDRNNRKRSFNTVKAASKACAKLDQ